MLKIMIRVHDSKKFRVTKLEHNGLEIRNIALFPMCGLLSFANKDILFQSHRPYSLSIQYHPTHGTRLDIEDVLFKHTFPA